MTLPEATNPKAANTGAADALAKALDQIVRQPTVQVPVACCAIGISDWAGYQAIKKGEFPAPVISVGRRIVVQSAGLRQLLGLEAS